MKRGLLCIAIFALLYVRAAAGQYSPSCPELQKLIKATYNFKPSKLSAPERNVKSAEMDRVWDTVKANPSLLVPCLRQALGAPNADQWFRFDGSILLVELDPSDASKQIQVRNLATVDLDDVDLRAWVTTLAQRGSEGFDVSEAGARWLAYPSAKYFLPEHGGYEVDVSNGALFIYGSMDESMATPALLNIIKQPKHPGREIALWILMSQATADSLRALQAIDSRGFSPEAQRSVRALLEQPSLLQPRAKPQSTRGEYVKAFQNILKDDWDDFAGLVERVPDGEKDVVAVLRPEDLTLVRKVRRKVIAKANQHAIEYYNSFTQILMTLTWKPELVGKGRT